MDQKKIISYAMQEVLRRLDHENCRLTPGGNYVSKEMVDKYQAEYDELKTMLLKLDGKKDGKRRLGNEKNH